jgi:hypothetical protein
MFNDSSIKALKDVPSEITANIVTAFKLMKENHERKEAKASFKRVSLFEVCLV